MQSIQWILRRWSVLLTASVITLTLSGCASNTGDELPAGLTMCPEERPQICTREYNPVCATRSDNSTATYATGCTACADADVAGWLPGACPDNP